MLIQFVFVLTLFAAFLMTWRRARQHVISAREAVLWSLLWIAAAFVILSPQTTTIVAHFFGVGRGADFIVYGSIILVFILLFKIFVSLEQLERKLTELVRKDALRDLSSADSAFVPHSSPPVAPYASADSGLRTQD